MAAILYIQSRLRRGVAGGLFQQKEAFLVEGRAFTQEEYGSGKPVCVISEALALSSGLSLGDSLDLRFYWGRTPLRLEAIWRE